MDVSAIFSMRFLNNIGVGIVTNSIPLASLHIYTIVLK